MQSYLLDQPALERQVSTLNVSHSITGISAGANDGQLVHRAAELRLVATASRNFVVNVKNASLVADRMSAVYRASPDRRV